MKKISALIVLLLLLSLSGCGMSAPRTIPMGTWEYRLILNGMDIGSATVINEEKESEYLSTITMNMSVGNVQNSSKQIVTESRSFEPVKLEIYNRIVNGKNEQKINTIASFKGKEITVTSGSTTSTVSIDHPFVLDGNFFITKMIEKRFETGSHVESSIYDPSFELENTIRVKVLVVGQEKLTINGNLKKVFHMKQIIENFKEIDIYIDEKGVTQKADILMLNNRIELVIKE
jgi:hypothetical protein